MKNLILRNTPEIAGSFVLKTIESDNGKNTYTVYCENNKVVICGDCKISQAMGYYDYLKRYCGVNLSHCGNRKISVTEIHLFDGEMKKTVVQDKRVYMNYCTYGYSMAFWKWEQWEQEIDFMAMNGINMPLSVVGTEAVWYYTLRDFTYSEKGALSHLSGPGFWPWQLMGCLTGYFSLTDVKYIESRLELGKKIIDREIELGMTPIQQGFDGKVPKTFSKLFKRIRISMVASWCNFPLTFQLDPLDPIYRKFGLALLEKQKQLFGSYHYYACDPFHGNKPPVKKKGYLWKVGRTIDTILKEFDPCSVWVMQSVSLREEIVKSIPRERLLILDLSGEIHNKTEEFWGYDFILGSVHSYGDRTTLHGSIKHLAENQYACLNLSNCKGTGIFTEGIFQNPLYYDLSFEMMTKDDQVSLDEWLKDYAYRRYGSRNESLVNAVKRLYESCYSESCTGRETGSVICARPATELLHTAPFDNRELRYDNKILLSAVTELLSVNEKLKDGYEYDVCDITRQVLSNMCSGLYDQTMEGYLTRNVGLFERSSNDFLKICEELDELLQSRSEFSLAAHLKEVDELALTQKDKENFELNLLTQITIWGPVADSVNYDYAWKEWGGLIGTFYAKRWQTFFERLALAFTGRGKYSTKTKKQVYERNIYQGSQFYKGIADFEKKWLSTVDPDQPTDTDTVELARTLIEKYKGVINN